MKQAKSSRREKLKMPEQRQESASNAKWVGMKWEGLGGEAGGILQETGPAEVAGLRLWGKLIWGSLSRRVHGDVHFRRINLPDMFLLFFFLKRKMRKC